MHSHQHDYIDSARRLRIAFFLTLLILVIEAAAGYASNSLALMSDAGHILTDACALGLAWYAMRLRSRPPNARNTFGYQRGGILAALANASLLVVVAAWVTAEAGVRLQSPEHVAGGLVIIGAAVAVLVNAYVARSLHRGEDNLNVRAALLHVLGDIGASLAVIASGAAIVLWHVYILDPVLSLLIALLIAVGAWEIVRETVLILMEATPRGVELERLTDAMQEVPGVLDVHDLHVWALSDGFRLLSAHVAVPDQRLADTAALLADLKLMLRRRFHIEHATIEVECVDCRRPQPRPIRLHERGGGA